jgi:hypothetical protein
MDLFRNSLRENSSGPTPGTSLPFPCYSIQTGYHHDHLPPHCLTSKQYIVVATESVRFWRIILFFDCFGILTDVLDNRGGQPFASCKEAPQFGPGGCTTVETGFSFLELSRCIGYPDVIVDHFRMHCDTHSVSPGSSGYIHPSYAFHSQLFSVT